MTTRLTIVSYLQKDRVAVQSTFLSNDTFFRVLTFCALIAACTTGKQNLYIIAVTLGFAHYALALLYSRRKLNEVFSSVRTIVSFLAVTLAGIGLAIVSFPMAYMSVLHHNFNEVYMRDSLKDRDRSMRRLRLSCLVLNMSLFAAILRKTHGLKMFDPDIFFALTAIAGLWYVVELVRNKNNMTVRQLIDSSFYELFTFGALIVSFFTPIKMIHFFFYHFVYWALYPIPKMRSKGGPVLRNYALLHVALLPAVWLLITAGGNKLVDDSVSFWFGWLGYMHIAMSFALSDEQPRWISALFRKRSPAVTPVPRREPAIPISS